MLREFRDFALKGDVLDIAIGLIMALAFSSVVKSAIHDVLMPIIGLIVGKPNFDDIKIGESIEIGKFLTEAVNFLIIAAVLFLIVKAANVAMGKSMAGGDEETMKENLKESLKEDKE
ncbi:MAG TPA: large conductance mechanosensitive channel protein MscL [Aestuariivirga sp.]|jgi:large conductance mechanosensitive channel